MSTNTWGTMDLIPGRYPDAVGLTTVLHSLSATPAASAAVAERLLALTEASTGLPVAADVRRAVRAAPARIVDGLVVTPRQMSLGFDLLNAAYRAGHLPEIEPMPTMLSSGFDLATIERAPHRRPQPALEEIVPGVFRGDVPSSLIDAAGTANQVLAEVFDRLGRNEGRPTGTPFAVGYGGTTYTSLEELVLALAANRHSIEVRFEHRAANFADLKTRAADGRLLDVPVALMMRVEFEDRTEARVPAVHSEMVIQLRSHRVGAGPKIDADVHWYQGISGTGFFPADLLATPRWCGRKVVDSLAGDSACRAVALAGLLGSVINASAVRHHLALGGYGWTGVCNDSVGVIQHAIRQRTTAYPLFMRDATLAAELTARTEDRADRYHAEYARLKAAIAALPRDVDRNASAYGRALESIPWADGEEPFQSTVEAKRLLAARLHAAARP